MSEVHRIPYSNRVRDLSNMRFGKLLVVSYAGSDSRRESLWVCQCDCGKKTTIRSSSLSRKHSTACGGCRSTHGRSKTPMYRAWQTMFTRCYNTKWKYYYKWGGRGIRICERWRVFDNFLADMGERPAGMSIDRIDNDGDYEPSNCRWVTRVEQARNRRTTRFYTHGGVTRCVQEWAHLMGIKYNTLQGRLNKNFPPELVFFRGKLRPRA